MAKKRFDVCLFFLLIFGLPLTGTGLAQQQTQPAVKSPKDIKFTFQMSRSAKDFKWSETYFESYKKSGEVSYLNLAAEFCLKAINRLYNTRNLLSRTTRFYQQAEQKRLQACQFHDMLQKQSFLLQPVHHLAGSGMECQ